MKRLLKVLAAAIIFVGALGATAAAEQSCSLNTTGPDSTNTCKNTTKNTSTINCTNNVGVANINVQGSSSGDSTASNNTTSGNVTSGGASNSNSTSTSVDASCGRAAPLSEPKAPVGGAGGGAPTAVTASKSEAAKVASLPKTGANPLAISAVFAAVAGGAALASRFAATALRRVAL